MNITPEQLIQEMESEVLAYSLDQRQALKVFLALGQPDDAEAVTLAIHGEPGTREQLGNALADGWQPVGLIVAENLEPKIQERFVQVQWHPRPAWDFPDTEGSLAFLERVKDGLIAGEIGR